MWLINTTTLKLEYIIDPEEDHIEYAILSHTWETEEVSFQQFGDLDAARKLRGFAKIEKTCELARAQGLDYAWVDTCCIDKFSSSELSEAINSMFNWYRLSSVCYAFLADLADTPGSDPPPPDQAHVRDLDKCRWFSRGWTLQELIAPANAVFYNSAWNIVGDKIKLSEQIADITGIDAGVLLGRVELDSVPVCTRMSWAAERITSRIEDVAYCLLGIFGINLPLIYGEGRMAFQRLQEEILRTNDDMSILAWSPDSDLDPKFLPPSFRKSAIKPRFRGPFAWAPSEFADCVKLASGAGALGALSFSPLKMDEVHGSVFVTINGGLRVNYDTVSGATWLAVPGAAKTRGRRFQTTPYGNAFIPDNRLQGTFNIRTIEIGKFRIISHKDAMAMGVDKAQVHCLLRSTLDQEPSIPPPSLLQWPIRGHSRIGCSTAYMESAITLQGSSLRLLGFVMRDVHIQVYSRQDGTQPRRLLFLFCFGVYSGLPTTHTDGTTTSPQPEYFGVTFCKQSNDPISARVFRAIDRRQSTMYVQSIRNVIEGQLRTMLESDTAPIDPGSVLKNWSVVIELPCGAGYSQHVRCSTAHISATKPESKGTVQCFQLKFERGVAGRWVEFRYGETLRNSNFLTPLPLGQTVSFTFSNHQGPKEQQFVEQRSLEPAVYDSADKCATDKYALSGGETYPGQSPFETRGVRKSMILPERSNGMTQREMMEKRKESYDECLPTQSFDTHSFVE